MTTPQPFQGAERPPLLRNRRDRVLGGVCAGIAEHLGVDVLMIRLAAFALAIFSGGAAVLAYLIAWILIPEATESSRPSQEQPSQKRPPLPAEGGAREAWNAVGGQLKALAADFRASRPASTADPAADPSQRPRDPVTAVDSAMTALGQRLRDPQVQTRARQTATDLSTAIGASVGQLGRRGRRGEPPVHGIDASSAGSDEGQTPAPPANPEPRSAE
jgi:phage shock protein PspC (stress-responsive transcriptional regulator)